MKYVPVILLFLITSLASQAQTPNTYTIKADSVKITNCDSSELILENHTQGVPGFLFNTGNGRTIFKRGLVNLGNGAIQIGADTLKAWMQGGNSFGTTGVLGTLDNNHLDLYTNNTQRVRLTNGGNLLMGTTTDNGSGEKLQIYGSAGMGTNGTGATPADGLLLANNAAATNTIYQYSPALRFRANGWNGTTLASVTADWRIVNAPTQAGTTASPVSNLQFQFSNNGGAYSTIAYMSTNGAMSVSGPLSAQSMGASTTINITNSGNAFLYSPTALTYGLISLNNPTAFRVYGFDDGLGNTEYLELGARYASNEYTIMSGATGTGTPNRTIAFGGTAHVLVGTTTDNGAGFQVNGTSTISSNLSVPSINKLTSLAAASGSQLSINADPLPNTGAIVFAGNHLFNGTTSQSLVALSANWVGNNVYSGVDQSSLWINPTYNMAGQAYNGNIRGILYNPTITSLGTGTPHHIAWENVTGNMIFGSTSGHVMIGKTADDSNSLQVNGTVSIEGTGNLGIGTSSPTAQLHTTGTVRFAGLTQDNTQSLVLVSDANGNLYYRTAASLAIDEPLRSSLAVNGTITAKKLQLSPGNWPDYVFDSAYSLPPLADVETYIHNQHHLPGIASAAEVQKDGNDVGATQEALLRKIEELTLYNIDQSKKIDTQNDKLATQQKELTALKAEIEELKAILLKK